MLKFKQFILESNFNRLPSYITDQIKKLITDYIDRGCMIKRSKNVVPYTPSEYYKPSHLGYFGNINITHLNERIFTVPIRFSENVDSGGVIYTDRVGNNIGMRIHISLVEFQNIQNNKERIADLYSVLVHETQHAIDRIKDIFKNRKKYENAVDRFNNSKLNNSNASDLLPAYRDYIMSPVEMSAVSSEIYHTINEYYSTLKTKLKKQLFLQQLNVFIKSDNIYDTYIGRGAELKLPPYFETAFYKGFFSSLEPGSKIYKKIKGKLLNLYNNLLVQSNIT
tara:strand:- start:17523 stop:18362 length:840 start_codon:yes stop_codon:yes gene_type:complete